MEVKSAAQESVFHSYPCSKIPGSYQEFLGGKALTPVSSEVETTLQFLCLPCISSKVWLKITTVHFPLDWSKVS